MANDGPANRGCRKPRWQWCVRVKYDGLWEVMQTRAPHRAGAKFNIRETLRDAGKTIEDYGTVYPFDDSETGREQ